MPAEAATHPELEILDLLITRLEEIITESDEQPLLIDSTDQPKRAIYRVLGSATASTASTGGRKPAPGEALFLDDTRLVLRCPKTEVVRLTPVEVTVQAEKSGRGETYAVIVGKVNGIKRVRGGYEIDIEVSEKRKNRITPGQRLRECLGKGDAAAWNRWCQDIKDSIELMGMDLKRADLAGYDLCCADLSGTDLSEANLTGAILSGADLSKCKMERVKVSGTDFFRARMNRDQASLLPLSGMPEVESIIFEG